MSTRPRVTTRSGGLPYAAAARSHRGQVREANEDTWLSDPARGLFAVIDGMGGARAGAQASAITRKALERAEIRNSADLRSAFQQSHEDIRAYAEAHPEDAGLGCVATSALLRGGRLTIAHVGDTRAYLSTQTGCEQLTRDHTVVAELQERHVMTEAAAGALPGRHRVTRDLGSGARRDSSWIDLGDAHLAPGDLVLLCTDGLTDLVDDVEIARILGRAREDEETDLERLAERLVELTLERGAHDNVTVVLIRRLDLGEEDTETIALPVPVMRRAGGSRPNEPAVGRWRAAIASGLAALLVGGAVGYWANSHFTQPLAADTPTAQPRASAGRVMLVAGARPATPVALDTLAGVFDTSTALTALGPLAVTRESLETTVGDGLQVELRGFDLRFSEDPAAWRLNLGPGATLVLRQASIRAANLSLEVTLDAQARLSIIDSHLDIGSITVAGPEDARIDIDGGWVQTSVGAVRSTGPDVHVQEGGGQPSAPDEAATAATAGPPP